MLLLFPASFLFKVCDLGESTLMIVLYLDVGKEGVQFTVHNDKDDRDVYNADDKFTFYTAIKIKMVIK